MTRIAFVDNQRDDLQPVKTLLKDEEYVVETFSNGQFALESIQRRLPQLVVISLPTSKLDGVTLIDRIRSTSIIPVIMLSTARDEIDEIMGLRYGADDYIYLPVSPRLLAERIKAILRRQAILLAHTEAPTAVEQVLVCGDLVMDPRRHSVCWKERNVGMTATEFQMLHALARRPGIVKSRDQLMSASYNDAAYVEDRTIDSHIKRIRKKLKAADPEFSCIQTLYGVGYRFIQHVEGSRDAPAQSENFEAIQHVSENTLASPALLRSAPWQSEPAALSRVSRNFVHHNQ